MKEVYQPYQQNQCTYDSGHQCQIGSPLFLQLSTHAIGCDGVGLVI